MKQIWAYIKEHDLQNPQDRRKIIPDEVLGTFLTAPVNMMSMNSQLSKHCFTKGTHTLLLFLVSTTHVPPAIVAFVAIMNVHHAQITYDVPHCMCMYTSQTERWTNIEHKMYSTRLAFITNAMWCALLQTGLMK